MSQRVELLTRLIHAVRHLFRSIFVFILVGVCYLIGLTVLAIFAAFVDSPLETYAPETSWAELQFVRSLGIIGPLAAVAILAMFISIMIDKLAGNRVDMRFYPLRRRMRSIHCSVPARYVLVGGVLITIGYLTVTLTVPTILGSITNGWFWPAERILIFLMLAWTTIWFAEAAVRPIRTPLVAAVLFGAASLIVGYSSAARPSVTMQSAFDGDRSIRSISDLVHTLGCAYLTWERGRIPSWATETTRTKHFVYYHAPDDKPVQTSLDAQEQHYEFCKQILGIDLPQQIHFIKYTQIAFRDSFAPEVGGLGGGGYVHSQSWFQPHEAVHSYLSSRNHFLNEGIAEAFGTSFYYFWGDVCDEDFKMSIPMLYKKMDRVLGGNREDRVVGSNFVRWLFHRYGSKKLVTAIREAYVEGSRTRQVIARIYGMPFDDLASQWERDQEWLREQPPPEGFFVNPPWKKEVQVPAGEPASSGN